MRGQLGSEDILVLAAACRQWPANSASWWYLGQEPVEAGCRVGIEAIYQWRGAKDG